MLQIASEMEGEDFKQQPDESIPEEARFTIESTMHGPPALPELKPGKATTASKNIWGKTPQAVHAPPPL